MQPLVKLFGMPSFDLAASAENTKASRFYSEKDNSLIQKWHRITGILFLNPPFDKIEPWAKKCREEKGLGAEILFLVPASVGSEWFHNNVHRHALVLALRGRIPFDPANPDWGYPKDCILCHYSLKVTPGFDTWKWKI